MRVEKLGELVADQVVHALGVGLGTVAAIVVVGVVALGQHPDRLPAIAVYAAGLVAMLACSAAYNVLRSSRRRDWLRRFDHAAIFVMIAGTYTPFTLMLGGAWSVALTAVIWGLAAIGIAIKLWRPRRLEPISTALYLALGWIGLIGLDQFTTVLEVPTLALLLAGGLVYSSGVVFHLWRALPYHNAIWHGFVLVAAGIHYGAVLTIAGA